MKNLNVIVDFDVIKYMVASRGITFVPAQGYTDMYVQAFDLGKSIEAYESLKHDLISYLERKYEKPVSKWVTVYTSKETTRHDYFRTWIDNDYKKHRGTKSAGTTFGTPVIADSVKRFEPKAIPAIYGLEADDMISLIAQGCEGDTVVISTDKDFKVNFTVLNPKSFEISEPDPDKIHQLMCIGDSADNIKGLKGVGDKTYLKLKEANPESLGSAVKELYEAQGLDYEWTKFNLTPIIKEFFTWDIKGKSYLLKTPECNIYVDVTERTWSFT